MPSLHPLIQQMHHQDGLPCLATCSHPMVAIQYSLISVPSTVKHFYLHMHYKEEKMTNHPVLSPATTYDYLTRALQLLEKPGNGISGTSWIQMREAVNKRGQGVAPESEQADAWCVIGALKAVTHHDPDPDAAYRYVYSILNAANPVLVAIGGEGLSGAAPALNDHVYSFDQIRSLFENAKLFLLRHGA